MSAARQDWANAFLMQARSDFLVYKRLAEIPHGEVPVCHRLHYLQMATEKLAKAYRSRDTQAALHGEEGLLRKHVGLVKFMRALLKSPQVKEQYQGRNGQLAKLSKIAEGIAREVEKLAPAVDEDTAPANTEYPWLDAQRVVAPCDYAFPNLSSIVDGHPDGGRFLKLIKDAIDRFDSTRIS